MRLTVRGSRLEEVVYLSSPWLRGVHIFLSVSSRDLVLATKYVGFLNESQ